MSMYKWGTCSQCRHIIPECICERPDGGFPRYRNDTPDGKRARVRAAMDPVGTSQWEYTKDLGGRVNSLEREIDRLRRLLFSLENVQKQHRDRADDFAKAFKLWSTSYPAPSFTARRLGNLVRRALS